MKSVAGILNKKKADINMTLWITGQHMDIGTANPHTIVSSACAGIDISVPFSKQTMVHANLPELVLYDCMALKGDTDITSHIEIILSQLSLKQISIPKPGSVRGYLLQYPEMADILTPACQELKEQFGENGRLSLELYIDPEIEDDYLALYVRQKNYDSHILDIIEAVSKKLEKELSERSGYLLITSDFKSLG